MVGKKFGREYRHDHPQHIGAGYGSKIFECGEVHRQQPDPRNEEEVGKSRQAQWQAHIEIKPVKQNADRQVEQEHQYQAFKQHGGGGGHVFHVDMVGEVARHDHEYGRRKDE